MSATPNTLNLMNIDGGVVNNQNHHYININPSDRFKINSIISDTLQGRMYQGLDNLTNKLVAVKETWKVLVNLKQCRKGTIIKENYLNEIHILQYLKSKIDCPSSIIGIISSWEEDECFMYAMEYCDCCLFNYMKKIHEKGDMKIYCDAMKKLPQRTMNFRESCKNPFLKYVQKIFIKLTNTVNYLHENNIVHLDLSLENIMLQNLKNNNHINDPSLKIIDFGLAKYFGENASNFTLIEKCGKNAYMSPEVYDINKYYDGRKADIWSLGIILFIMLVGTHLVDKPCYKTDERFYYLMNNNVHGIALLLKNWRRLRLINDDILDLFNKIFQYENKRINMQQLLKHPFLDTNRYNISHTHDDDENDDESMHFIQETTPTPSSIDTLSDYYYDIEESCNNIIIDNDDENDTESTLSNSIVNFRGFDICAQGNKNYIDVTNVNYQQNESNNNNNNNNIQSRVVVEAMKSASNDDNEQIDDLIKPQIGNDGMFKFGINNNDTSSILRYHF